MSRGVAPIERLLEKCKMTNDLIEQFGITDGPSCLNAFYYLNACGYLSTSTLRFFAKGAIKIYSIDKELLEKHIQFYITECSPYLKSAFILFPVFMQRCPEAISTASDLIKAVRWINAGIQTGDTIVTIVHRCCNAILQRAIALQLTRDIITECFTGDYLIRKQWTLSLKTVGSRPKKQILDEIRQLNGAGDEKLRSDDELLAYLLTNEYQQDPNENEADSDLSDSDFGEDEPERGESTTGIDDLCRNIATQLNFSDPSNELSVLTMADVIKQLSFHQQTQTDSGVEINKMPRNAIRKFYKSIKALVKEQCQYEDVEHFKRLLIIQVSTHSKKIISFCQTYLEDYAKRLKPEDFNEANEFFWLHFCKDPALFRAFAVSTVLPILIMHTKMDIVEVTRRFCELSQEYTSKFLQNTFDIILSSALTKNYGFGVDFHSVYNILMKFSRYNWYKSWRATYDGLFCSAPIPIPLAYFKFRDVDLLDNSLAQLVVILSNKMSLLEFVERLQFSLNILDRTHWMGPLGFNADPWSQSKSADIVNFLEAVDRSCPVFLFKKLIRSICSRFKTVM